MKKVEKSPNVRNQINSKQEGKFCQRLLPALIASCFACGPVYANPTGAQVVAGQVSFNNNGNVLSITNTPGSIINWLNFSIGVGQTTQFLQQNSNSSVLNRIIGQNPTQIFGSLKSNGKVYLINPNGILFEQGSQINVGGLVASSLDMSNADFIAGKNNFNAGINQTPGSVVNQGSITTPSGGSIYLIAPQVQNSGILTSPQGDILLAAGHSVQLLDGANPNVQVVISAPTDQALNLGQVIAQGGKIGLFGTLVNQNGVVNADSAVVGENGQIILKSSQTTMLGAGSQTSAMGTGSGTTGGTIELLGPQVGIVDNALVNASGQNGGGKVIVGGDFHGANPTIQNADEIYIGSNAVIKADAVQSGNGGQVAVWSNDATRFYGTISAQGGTAGGNGGFVETSSKNYLDFSGKVNLKAPLGASGTLLLDPYSITIDGNYTTNAPSGTGPAVFTNPGSATSDILSTDIETQLASGNVVVSTLVVGGGTITVSSPITWNSGNTLNLTAAGGIAINANINALGTVNGNLALKTTGGDITESSVSIAVGQLSAVATNGNVNLNSRQNYAVSLAGSANGNFTFLSNNAISVGSANGYTGISSIATNGAITLSSYGGSITTTPTASISGPSLTLYSLDGIGAVGLPLSTKVGTLTATKGGSGSGDIVISNTGQPLSIVGITDNYQNSNIYVIADNAITVNTTTIDPNTGLPIGGIVNNATGTSNIGLKAVGDLTINGPITPTAGNNVALLSTTGSITEAFTASITAASLSANAPAGVVSLNSSYNAISNVSGNAAFGFALTSSTGITVSAAASAGYTQAFPALTAGINVNSSTGYIALQAGGNLNINSPLNVQSTQGLIGGTVALGSIGGNIAQTSAGLITSGNLSANATGSVNLVQYNSIVGNVAGTSGTGSFMFGDNTGFNVGTVSGFGGVAQQTGITAIGQPIRLYSYQAIGSTGGTITGSTLNISAYTGIGSQTAPLQTAVGGITLTNGSTGFGGGDVVISNSSTSLIVHGVTQSNGGSVFINSSGAMAINGTIATTNGDVGLMAGGNLALNGPVSASGTLALMTTSGNITQFNTGAGITSTSTSAVAANGAITLDYQFNNAGTIAGSASNGFSFLTNNSIMVGSVPLVGSGFASGSFLPAITGITTTGGNISLTSGYSIGTTSGATITGPSLTLSATHGIGNLFNPLSVNVGALSATNGNASGGGDIVISNSGQALSITGITENSSSLPGSIYVVSANPITVIADITNSNGNLGSNIGINGTGGITFNANVNALGNTVALTASAGDIVQTSGNITAKALSATDASGSILLNSVGNAVGTVAGYSSGDFTLTNSGPLIVGSVGAIGGVDAPIYFTPVDGINVTAGNIGLQAAGNLSINSPLSTSISGIIALGSSAGNITQAAILTGGSLSANASGGYVNLPLNNVIDPPAAPGIIAGSSAGGFLFTNTSSFNVGSVAAVGGVYAQTGISAPGQTITLSSTNGSIGSSGGSVSGATASITAFTGVGTQTSPLLTSVNSLSVINGMPNSGGGDIAISNSGTPLTITGITQNNGGNIYVTAGTQSLTASGAITTSNGDIGLLSGGDLSVATLGTNGTVALQSTAGNIMQTGAISAAQLSAVANAGNVTLTNTGNSVTTVAGSAAGTQGFQFVNTADFTVGNVPLVGPLYSGGFLVPGVNGITTSTGAINLATATTGNITVNGAIDAGSNSINLTSLSGSILQGSSGSITTTGNLMLDAGLNVGASGATNALQTNVGSLDVTQANGIYLTNSGIGNLTVNQLLGSGSVNVSTAGSLTVPVGRGATDFTGNSITLVSAGNMTLGANNTFSAANGTGAIALYAGYTETPGSAPIANASASSLSQGGTFNGATIDLWANQFVDFLGTATYSSTQTYHPGPTVIDVYLTGETVTTKSYDGTTVVTITGGTLVGIPSFDLPLVTFTQSANFVSKNAGTNIPIVTNDTLTLPANLAGEFVFVQPTGLTGTIQAVNLTVSGQSAANKIYNGNTNATLLGGSLIGVLPADITSVSFNSAGSFATKNPGKNIPIITTDSISGASASNYNLVQPSGLYADIISIPSINQIPIVHTSKENYIVGLNLSTGSVANGDKLIGNSSENSGSGYSITFNIGTLDNDNANKLYCN